MCYYIIWSFPEQIHNYICTWASWIRLQFNILEWNFNESNLVTPKLVDGSNALLKYTLAKAFPSTLEETVTNDVNKPIGEQADDVREQPQMSLDILPKLRCLKFLSMELNVFVEQLN